MFFFDATNVLQKDGVVTIKKVIPLLILLERGLVSMPRTQPSLNAVKEALLNSIRKRFNSMKTSEIHIIATMLDPCAKLTFCGNLSTHFYFDITRCRDIFIRKLRDCDLTNTNIVDDAPISIPSGSRKGLFDFADTIPQPVSTLESRATAYLSSETVPACNVVEFWKNYPAPFQKMCSQILGSSPDTSTVERLF